MPRNRTFRIYDDDESPEGGVCKDGEGVRVSLADSAPGQRRFISDADLARHQALAATHRSGFVQDKIRYAVYDRALEHSLKDAIESRQREFDRLEKRSASAWRDGSAGVANPENYEVRLPSPDNANGNGNGDDDENGDNDHDENLAQAQADREAAREAARIERDRLGDEKWRTAGITDPNAALAIQRQAAAWRGGK